MKQNSHFSFGHSRISTLFIGFLILWGCSHAPVNSEKEALQAASQGRLKDLQKMIESKRATLQTRTPDGTTMLMAAASRGQVHVIKWLLSEGVDPQQRDLAESTALHYAAVMNQKESVEVLLDSGADPNVRDQGQLTPLMLAAQFASAGLVDLLASRSDINLADENGWTALFFSLNRKHSNIAAILIKRGASLQIRDKNGRSPADYAREAGLDLTKIQNADSPKSRDP